MTRITASAAALLALAWSFPSRASTTFPAAVDSHLGLKKTVEQIDPPQGCLLCHNNPNGGLGTNNAFGTLMKENGAVAAEDGKIGPALDALAQTDPRAIMDLVSGIDPNADPAALSGDPVPHYGCGSIAAAPARGSQVGALFGLGLACLALRRRAHWSSARHRSSPSASHGSSARIAAMSSGALRWPTSAHATCDPTPSASMRAEAARAAGVHHAERQPKRTRRPPAAA